MRISEIIGTKITEVWMWQRMNVHGLDLAEMWLELNATHIIQLPIDLDTDCNTDTPHQKAVRLLASNALATRKPQSSVVPACQHWAAKQIHQLMKALGLAHAAGPAQATLRKPDPSIAQVANQSIVDVLSFGSCDNDVYLELGNGCILGQPCAVPHGAGPARPTVYNSLQLFEALHGKNYVRFSSLTAPQ